MIVKAHAILLITALRKSVCCMSQKIKYSISLQKMIETLMQCLVPIFAGAKGNVEI